MEVIDLDSVNLNEDISEPMISLNKSMPSLAGAELLMNQNSKKKTDVENNNNETLNMSTLEKELNELTNTSSSIPHTIKINIKGDENPASENIASENITPIKKMGESEKTWDGYKQFNNIPLNPDKHPDTHPKKTREQILKEKFNYLRKLETIERKGARLSKQYTMESSLEEMIGEYETIKSEKEKSNSVKFQGRMLMAAVTGLEFLNNRVDPFDFKLDGWSEQVNENIDDYDDIFSELHEKYSSKAKMAPELKLLFQLSGSAIMLHMTNTMFKSSMPGMDDILRQNPELMQQFTNAAVNQMGDEKPGFGNFMNGMMNNNTSSQSRREPSPPPASMSAPPPPPVKTSNNGRMDNFTRPDIGFGRGGPEPGINVKNNMESANKPERSPRSKRPEMKRPSADIDALLSGLKTKTSTSSPLASTATKKVGLSEKKRRKISEKNTISLDF